MRIGIVSCDPGGAQFLSSFVSSNNKKEFIFHLNGHAIDIFKKKKIKFINLKKKIFFDKADKIILSTGWSTDFEIQNLIEAKKLKIKCITVLDHWSNLRERFIFKKKIYLPDEIWVFDLKAKKKIKEIFPNIKVILKRNYYFDYIKKFKLKKIPRKNSILYICDPKSRETSGYNEEVSFKFFIKNISKISGNRNYQITVKKHPLQKNVEKFFFKYKKIKFSQSEDIIKEISLNEIIVGSGSMALVIASILNKKVFSSIPPGAKFLLPPKRIRLIRKMI